MPDDFFAQEQKKMAVDAIKNCCREAWQVVQQDTNLKPLIRERPLASLAAAAAGGLVAGYLLTPPRGGRPKREHHDGVPAATAASRTPQLPGHARGGDRRHHHTNSANPGSIYGRGLFTQGCIKATHMVDPRRSARTTRICPITGSSSRAAPRHRQIAAAP